MKRMSTAEWHLCDDEGVLLEEEDNGGIMFTCEQIQEFDDQFVDPSHDDIEKHKQMLQNRREGQGTTSDAALRSRASDVSPRRRKDRDDAFERMSAQADAMRKRAAHRDGVVEVGSVVQVALHDADRAKVDDTNCTLVVVEVIQPDQNRKNVMYRVAGAHMH